jgi:hypothetical protein
MKRNVMLTPLVATDWMAEPATMCWSARLLCRFPPARQRVAKPAQNLSCLPDTFVRPMLYACQL